MIADRLQSESPAPGIGLLLVSGGHVAIAVSGERQAGSNVLIDPGDPWHLGSNTKSMTATLAARLVDRGLITWDTTIGERLGALYPNMNAAYRDVTLKHLLAHRAGLPANLDPIRTIALGGTDKERDAQADRAAYVGWILTTPPANGLNERDLYSNAGFVAAAVMLEQAARQSYEVLMQNEVFTPLGMTGAAWGPPGSPDTIDAPHGHRPNGRAVPPGRLADNPVAMNSAGRAHMPLAAIAAYLSAHLKGARGEDTSYLSEESWRILHSSAFGGIFALGWAALPDGTITHSGSNTMWLCQFVIDPRTNKAVAIVGNSGAISALQPHYQTAIETLMAWDKQ